MVADCFWNIDGVRNVDLLLGAEDPGHSEQNPLRGLFSFHI